MQRSPKGLIVNRSVTPDEMAQLGIRSEQIGCPDVLQEIKKQIADWRRLVKSYTEPNPATDGTLDRRAAAKALDAKLQAIEYSLDAAERNAASGNHYLAALNQAVSSFSKIHQLAIIDNEKAIAARLQSIEGARRGGSGRSAGKRIRNREMAQEFLERRGKGLGETALMALIGAARGLKRRQSIEAVKSGLEELPVGRPHGACS
jgi:hypothetical protein